MYSSINSSERKNTFLVRSRTQLSGMENFTEKKRVKKIGQVCLLYQKGSLLWS